MCIRDRDIEGVLYTKDGKKLIKAPAQMTGKYIVPEGVEEIEAFAFQNSHFDEIILPDSLEKIGTGAFQYSGIKKMTVPKGITEIEAVSYTHLDVYKRQLGISRHTAPIEL